MLLRLRPLRPVVAILFAQLLALPCSAQTLDYGSETRSYNLAHGRVVFTEKCMRCHESGRKGAPVLGDIEDWRDRLGQPLDKLIGHAIKGHGKMPARGDQVVTDQDIAAAVAFVVDRTRSLAAESLETLPPPQPAGPRTAKTMDESDKAAVHMFLMLFGKDRWK